MRAFIDTNIFVYATYPRFPQSVKSREFLKSCLSGQNSWYLSWGVIYEYLRVVTHPRLFPEGALPFQHALENVTKFSATASVEILTETSEHARFLRDLVQEPARLAGNILHDAHLVALMREHDLSVIYTADTDLNRFKGIEVVNPLAS
jgi:uncharacterized protein